jgi:hypothetical protein
MVRRAAVAFVMIAIVAGCSGGGNLTKVATRDGRVVVGRIVEAGSDAVVVRTADGQTITIRRADIVSVRAVSADDEKQQAGGEPGGKGGGTGTGGDVQHGAGVDRGGARGQDAGPRTDTRGRGGFGGGLGGDQRGGVPGSEVGGGSRGGPGTSGGGAGGEGQHPTGGGGTGATIEGREVSIPAGTAFAVRLETPVGSNTSHVNDVVTGRVVSLVRADGAVAIPEGARVAGVVSAVEASGPGKVGQVSVAFLRLQLPDGQQYDIATGAVTRKGRYLTKSEVAKRTGIGAAIGGVLGGAISGTKKAVGIGGTSGAAAALIGSGVMLAIGTTVDVALEQAVGIRVPTGR